MERLKYVDSMKGFAILFVVFYHLLWICVKDRESAFIPILQLRVYAVVLLPVRFCLPPWRQHFA